MTNETVRRIRIAKGLSQVEFAEQLGISRATIAGIESNSRNVSDKVRILISQKYGGDVEVAQAIINARKFEKLPQ